MEETPLKSARPGPIDVDPLIAVANLELSPGHIAEGGADA
jgi:hypothetical protein